MKSLLTLFSILFYTSLLPAETLMKCAVNDMSSRAARVNLIKDKKGDVKANLIFGTTISGTMFKVEETEDGLFVGSIRNKSEFWIKLDVSSTKHKNKYIDGYLSKLDVVYPTVLEPSGKKHLTTKKSDLFVCGKQIRNFGE